MAAYNIKDIKDKKKLINLANYGTAERRLMRPRVLIGAGEEKPFIEGDILDANATQNLIEDTYDKGRIFRSFSKEGKKIDKEIKELLEKTDENYEQLSSAIADNKEDADQKIDQLSSKVDNIESNIPNLRRVVDIQLLSVLDGTKTYLVTKQGDVQEQIQISDGEKGEQGEKGDPFTYEDFTPEQIEGLKVKGDRGISISSLEQTQTAYTSGGVNEFTVTLDDGTVSRWYVRNGQKGDATKIWVNANTVHSGYYDSDNHEIKLLNADGGIMSIIDATAFIKDGMISDAYVEDGYIVIVFNTDAGQTPIMIPVTDIFDADDYYTKLDTDARIAEDVLVETQRAEAAELQLTNNLAQEISDRQSGDTTLNTKIEEETTRATNAEEALSDAIDAEESTRIQEIDDLQDLLDAYIQSNNAAVQAEISRATTAENTLLQNITAEETRATIAEQNLQNDIDSEVQRATAAEQGLQTAVDELEQSAGQGITEVQQALNDEVSRATQAEQQISSDLSAEITRATNADTANTTAISNEVARATLSEQQNATDIDAIEALIPSQATSENQLADKAFVNSSIATNTATFVGTFNSITDLYAVTTADVNDYGYVVTTDSVGNTKYNRYKYDGSQWGFEYSLNNSSFTAEEWASIHSGMTQALREKLESLPSSATTSIGISVPTGFTVTGSPIISSGTIAINFENGYSIPTTASQTNWNTAYGWGNHANAGYVKQVKVGTAAYNPSSGIVSLPAYPTVPTKVSQLTNDAGYITSSASITGNAGSATKLQTARTIWGHSFNGTANVSGNLYMIDPNATHINANSAKLKFNSYDSDETRRSPYIQAIVPTSDNTYGRKRLGFFTSNAANYTDAFIEALSIMPDGKIGIGTTEPSYKLHVAGAANVIGITPSSDATYTGIIYNAVTDGYRWSINSNKDCFYWWNGNLNREVFGISNAGTVLVNLPTISCSTAVGTAAKVATINGYTLTTGNIVKIKFTKGNTSTSATLNISSTGAKGIRLDDGTAIASNTIAANDIVTMVYDGTYYRIKGINTDITDGYAAYVNGALAVRNLHFHDSSNGRIFSINGSGSITLKAPTRAGWAGGLNTYTHDGSTCLGGFGYYGTEDVLSYLYVGAAYDNPWVTFLPSGNVGIGTTEPAYKLDVQGTLGVNGSATIKSWISVDRVPYGALPVGTQLGILSARSKNAGTGNYTANTVIATFGSGETGTTVNNFPVRIGSTSGATWISAGESGNTFSGVNTDICNTENLYLTADGSIAMYTGLANNSTDYATKLALNIDTSQNVWIAGSVTLNNNKYLRAKDASGTARNLIGISSSNTAAICTATAQAGYDSYLSGNNLYLRYGTSLTMGMILNSSGNVGIGTDSPSYKLLVEGTLGVSGLITATGGVKGDVEGNATNVTGTVAIAHGGTGATTRLNAVKALTNENVGTSATYFLTITNSWGKAGYTSVADARTVLAMKGATSSAAGTAGVVPAAPKDGYNTKYLRADGTWVVPTNTKNTAGSTNSTSKLFLIGATSQDANPQTYSNSGVYTTSGSMYATNFYTTSDLSKKDNITSLSEHIRKFTLKETGKEHYGVIALEVPEMFRDGEEGSYTVNYNSILSYYVGLLENRVAELENKVKELSHGQSINRI